MTYTDENVKLLAEYTRLVIHIVHRANSSRGLGKTIMQEERRIVKKILAKMMGHDPAETDIDAICNMW